MTTMKRLLASSDYGISQPLTSSGPYKVLTMGNIQDGKITISENSTVSVVADWLVLRKGDLLYNRTNSLEQICKVGIFDHDNENITFASYLVRLRVNDKALPEYLNYLLNSRIIISIARSMAIPSIQQANLNPNRYTKIKLPYPPSVKEQKEITEFINKRALMLDELGSKLEEQIRRLNEYKQSIISNTVTGKIDVRGLVQEVNNSARQTP